MQFIIETNITLNNIAIFNSCISIVYTDRTTINYDLLTRDFFDITLHSKMGQSCHIFTTNRPLIVIIIFLYKTLPNIYKVDC